MHKAFCMTSEEKSYSFNLYLKPVWFQNQTPILKRNQYIVSDFLPTKIGNTQTCVGGCTRTCVGMHLFAYIRCVRDCGISRYVLLYKQICHSFASSTPTQSKLNPKAYACIIPISAASLVR